MRCTIVIILLFSSLTAFAQLNPAFVPLIPELLGTDVFFTTSRGRLYKVPVDSILVYVNDNGGGGGLTDGDKGDITVSSGGTVWNIDAGVVGPTELANTSVTPGSYTNTDITVDAQGRITAASSGSAGGVVDGDKGDITVSASGTVWNIDADVITSTEIAADAVGASEVAANAIGSSELASTAVTPGSYTNTDITVDADGRITAASNGSAGGGVSDGDKGDITVSGGGTVWNIDPSAVGQSEIATDGVGSLEIATAAVGSDEIATNAVGSTEIAADAVGSSELASTAVTPGSYTNPNITVDSDGRITTASNGSTAGPGTGTQDRVAYWNTTSTLGSFPLELNVSNTRFTQSTGVRLPRGATSFEPSADQGFIRFDTDKDEFTAVRDVGEGHEVVRVGGVQRFGVSGTATISPVKDCHVVAYNTTSYTLTISDADLDDGTSWEVMHVGTGTLTLDSTTYSFVDINNNVTSTVTLAANKAARLILQATVSGRWYFMEY